MPGVPTPMRGQDMTERKDSSRRVLLAGSSLFKWVFHQSILVNLDQKIIFTLMRQEHFRLSLWEEKLKAPPEPGWRAGWQERVLRVSRWGQCRAAGRGQSRWSSTRCPHAGTPPAPGWTWCGWRAAAASRWCSWYTVAQTSSAVGGQGRRTRRGVGGREDQSAYSQNVLEELLTKSQLP